MPQVTIRRPFGELDLCGQLRLEPQQFFISSLVKAHWVRFRSGRFANGQTVDRQPLEPARHFTANLWHKPVPHLGGVEEPFALVISDYQSIRRIPRRVAANNDLLPPVDLVLEPCAGFRSLARKANPCA